jgi:hypothetical protein
METILRAFIFGKRLFVMTRHKSMKHTLKYKKLLKSIPLRILAVGEQGSPSTDTCILLMNKYTIIWIILQCPLPEILLSPTVYYCSCEK